MNLLTQRLNEHMTISNVNFTNQIGKLLDICGWDIICEETGIIKPSDRNFNARTLKENGISFIAEYKCPIIPETKECIIGMISLDLTRKNLCEQIKCAIGIIDSYRKDNRGISINTSITGLLFAPEEIQCELKKNIGIYASLPLFVVDIEQIVFIIESIECIRESFINCQFEFIYPRTTIDSKSKNKVKLSGSICPIQYLNSDTLTVKIKSNNGDDFLFMTTRRNYDKEVELQFHSLAEEKSRGWTDKAIISFPEITVQHIMSYNHG